MKSKILLGICLVTIVSCGKKKGETKYGTVTLNVKDGKSTTLNLSRTTLSDSRRDLPIATTADGEGLQSLKMYFRRIEICGSLTESGSGYSNTTGCAPIYINDSDTYSGMEAPTAAHRSAFAAAGEGKFYDILSDTERASLNKGASVPVGAYNYGIIETHPWVKIKAKSGNLCTKTAGAVEASATGGDGIVTYYTKTDSLSCGSGSGNAEEVLAYITNANTHFKFLSPFNVAEGDSVLLDLAFNLDREVRATEGETAGNLQAADAWNSFYVPMIRVGAAPRKAADTTKVETYIMGSTSDKEQVRIQLYYTSSDTTKSILGINATVLGTSSSAVSKANKAIYTSSVSQSGDEVTLKDWEGTEKVKFTRGAAGTATFVCANSDPQMLETCTAGGTATFSYSAPTTTDL